MFKYLVWASALAVALCAAFFSVTGIATLFSGRFWSVLAMASTLEIGKLVAASFLYRYWKSTASALKIYLTVGVLVLMFITSLGIYGYLSSAYAEVAAVPQNTMNQISSVESRKTTVENEIARLQSENERIDIRQGQAQSTLDNILAGETGLSQRSAWNNLRTEIEELDSEREINNERINQAMAQRDSLEEVRLNLDAGLNTDSKVGTFIYIARTLDVPLDTIVKWFVLVIVFVFDPLAVALILAYNNIVMRERGLISAEDIEEPHFELATMALNRIRKTDKVDEGPDEEDASGLTLNRLERHPDTELEPQVKWSREGKRPE